MLSSKATHICTIAADSMVSTCACSGVHRVMIWMLQSLLTVGHKKHFAVQTASGVIGGDGHFRIDTDFIIKRTRLQRR